MRERDKESEIERGEREKEREREGEREGERKKIERDYNGLNPMFSTFKANLSRNIKVQVSIAGDRVRAKESVWERERVCGRGSKGESVWERE